MMVAMLAPGMKASPAKTPPLPANSLLENSRIVLQAPRTPPLPAELERIGWCESRNRQFGNDGKPLRGEENLFDVGKYQINELFWGEEAKSSGYDLSTEEGNEAMALKIFYKYGTAPWLHSQNCWKI